MVLGSSFLRQVVRVRVTELVGAVSFSSIRILIISITGKDSFARLYARAPRCRGTTKPRGAEKVRDYRDDASPVRTPYSADCNGGGVCPSFDGDGVRSQATPSKRPREDGDAHISAPTPGELVGYRGRQPPPSAAKSKWLTLDLLVSYLTTIFTVKS